MPSFRALSGRLKFTVRRHKLNEASLSRWRRAAQRGRRREHQMMDYPPLIKSQLAFAQSTAGPRLVTLLPKCGADGGEQPSLASDESLAIIGWDADAGQQLRHVIGPQPTTQPCWSRSCIVKSFRSRRSFISSPLWTPQVYGLTSQVE